ncbi:hypothetical protein [Anaerosacchariphilus polymeriproducens]|nr:hypothetical protein [Anaerosacchariphilus polymeriproducens]
MLSNVNWNGVGQSILDTWLPLFGWIGMIVVVIIIICMVRKKRK